MLKSLRSFGNPFHNPFRLIHDLYAWKIWFREYRSDKPELKSAWDQKNQNIDHMLAFLFWFMYVPIIVLLVIWWLTIRYSQPVVDSGILT